MKFNTSRICREGVWNRKKHRYDPIEYFNLNLVSKDKFYTEIAISDDEDFDKVIDKFIEFMLALKFDRKKYLRDDPDELEDEE